MTEINMRALREQLIDLYNLYLRDSTNTSIKEVAQSVYADYETAIPFLSEPISNAIGWLINIGTDLEPLPTKEEIKKLIADLKTENEQS